MSRLERLNGWQRLWVVSAVIYFVVVAFTLARVFPDCSKISDNMVQRFMYYFPSPSNADLESYKRNVFNTLEDNQIAFKINTISESLRKALDAKKTGTVLTPDNQVLLTAWSGAHSNDDAENFNNAIAYSYHAYQICLSFNAGARLFLIFKALLAWLVPISLLYLLGWSGGWVYRGFRK